MDKKLEASLIKQIELGEKAESVLPFFDALYREQMDAIMREIGGGIKGVSELMSLNARAVELNALMNNIKQMIFTKNLAEEDLITHEQGHED